jgi:hypothetical protein
MEDLMDLYKMDISGLYKTLLREKHQAVFGAPARRASAVTGVLDR